MPNLSRNDSDLLYVVNALSMQRMSDQGWVPFDAIKQCLPNTGNLQEKLNDMVNMGHLEGETKFSRSPGLPVIRWRPVFSRA